MAGNTTIIQPDVTVTLRGDVQTVQNTAHRVLALGQIQPSVGATAVSGELQEQIGNDNSQDTLFGLRSMLTATIDAFKGTLSAPLNRITRIDAIGLDDNAGGSVATGNVTFTDGPATADAVITVVMGSSRNHSYEVIVTSGDTVTEIGQSLLTLNSADIKSQSQGINTAGDVAFTSIHKGVVGNSIGIKVIGSIPGVSIAITAFTGGAGNPDLTTLFEPIASERYNTILYPAEWGLSTLTDFLDPRFNVSGEVLDGVGIVSITDTFSAMQTIGLAENSQSLVIDGILAVDDSLYKGPSILELTYEAIGYVGAERALRLTEGANISQFVIGGGALDSTGGVHISSKPYFNTPFPLSPIIPTGKGLSTTEIESLLTAGVSVRGNNISGNSIIWGEVVTTYKTDAASNPDTSFKFLNSVDTGTAIREFFFNNTRAAYAQSRLTDGDLIPRVASANQGSVEAFLTGLYLQLTAPEFSLTRSGAVNVAIFKDNLVVILDLSAGKVSADMVTPIVVQFREFDGTINIKF